MTPDKELESLSNTELIDRILLARKTFRCLKASHAEELEKADAAIDAYAKDNALLRSKIESLEEQLKGFGKENE